MKFRVNSKILQKKANFAAWLKIRSLWKTVGPNDDDYASLTWHGVDIILFVFVSMSAFSYNQHVISSSAMALLCYLK